MAFLRSFKPSCKSLPLGLWERRGVRPQRLQRSHPCHSKGSFQNLVVLQDGSGHKAGRTVADTAKLDSWGHNGIVRPSPRRGPSAESVQVEPWVVQFANVANFSLKAAEYLQGAETSVKVQLVAEHHLQKQALSSKQRRLWDPGWDWHGEAAAGTEGWHKWRHCRAGETPRGSPPWSGVSKPGPRSFCASSSGIWRCLACT